MANIITVDCREQPIERVIVFNDRAEVKRLITADLAPGNNEVHIKNISQFYVINSIRVDGRGDYVIHEVKTKTQPALTGEIDSLRCADLRAQLEAKKTELKSVTDKIEIQKKRIEALDKMLGTGILPKDGHLDVNGGVLDNISKFYSFYEDQSSQIRSQLRETQAILKNIEEERKTLQDQLNSIQRGNGVQNIFSIALESTSTGQALLEISYQVLTARWTPSYAFRVDTTGEKPSIKVLYFGEINQNTGEDWDEVQLVLSTAQPCLGGNIPELGTVEASIYRPPPPRAIRQPSYVPSSPSYGNSRRLRSMKRACDEGEESDDDMGCGLMAVAEVQEQTLSSEFIISRPTVVLSGSEATKVTIGIFELHPQLVHECVPSKSRAVFLAASAVNISSLPLLVGQAAVYHNNSFVANVCLKNVSPGERFSCSLGVDSAVRVDYRPAKRYAQQIGIINTKSSIITEQVINIRNTRNTPILLVVKECIPRSTDNKIAIKLLHPTDVANHEQEKNVNEAPSVHKEGAVINHKNNLEWTVKLNGGAIQDLVLKYAVEHPRDEKIEFTEKF